MDADAVRVIIPCAIEALDMVAARRSRRTAASRRQGDNAVPAFLQEMLEEAAVGAVSDEPERPLKRRRRNNRETAQSTAQGAPSKHSEAREEVIKDEDDEDDEEIAFEDVPLPPATVQTMELDSDDDEDDEDEGFAFEDVLFTSDLKESPSQTKSEAKDLELNLTAEKAAITPTKRAVDRRKPLTKEERDRRTRVHQVHLACLLAHVSRRNHWCNDSRVQDRLRPLLNDKMLRYLNPGSNLSQFGRTESLKNGLQQAGTMWKARFEVTERGLRRALWAEDVADLEEVRLLFLGFRVSMLTSSTSMNHQVIWTRLLIVMPSEKPRKVSKDLGMLEPSYIAHC